VIDSIESVFSDAGEQINCGCSEIIISLVTGIHLFAQSLRSYTKQFGSHILLAARDFKRSYD
jgi:hypothetical protein